MKTSARASGAFPGCWESAFPPFASGRPEHQADWPPMQLPGGCESPASFESLASFWLAAYTFKNFVLFYTHPGGPGTGSDDISIQ